MVCLTHTKHFLSDEGIANFSDWFKQLTSLLMKQPGFISICYAQDPDDQHAVHVWIEFKGQDDLKQWLSSSTCTDINKKLDVHRIRPYRMTHFDVVDAASAST